MCYVFHTYELLNVSFTANEKIGKDLGRSHLREESLRKWKEVVPCILAQAELEKRNKGVHSAFEVCESINSKYSCESD